MPSSTDRQRRAAGLALGALATVPVFALAALLVALAPAPASGGPAGYPDLPVPGHTGGFGEPTCHACHFDSDLNAPGGALRVEGFPEAAEPGRAYPLTVRLERADMAAAGFQLAIRSAGGAQAGALASTDDRTVVTERDGVQYAQHAEAGTPLTGDGETAWSITWTAPADSAALRKALRLHVVANAANGDRSEFGDVIYSLSLGR